jgi:hypothetical protein
VLFDGEDFFQFTGDGGKAIGWKIADGAMEVVPNSGSIITRREFRDFAMHVEFNVPYMPEATGQGRGNSGVYIQKRYELQILDSYGLESQDNDCGSIYKTKAPDKNVCLKPGEWQYYDIVFTAAKWAGQKKVANARITVCQNGALIQNDYEIPNKTGAGRAEGPTAGPILLQEHHNNVKFRNVWIVPLHETAEQANSLTEQEAADGWKLLFDGKTSKGWRSALGEGFPKKGWAIKDGAFVVDGPESKGGGDIITVNQYSNFELKVDYKLTPKANTGIKYYVMPELLAKGTVIGVEYQLYDEPQATKGTDTALASAYDLLAAHGATANPVGEWNSARILSKNGKVEHWLNGRMVLEYDRLSEEFQKAKADSKFKGIENFGTLEKGYILLQEHGNEAAFRNIKIREL